MVAGDWQVSVQDTISSTNVAQWVLLNMKTSWLPDEGVDKEVDVEEKAAFLSPQAAFEPFSNC
ncbi:hypothetical protein RGR602_PC01735 (plasmid) [Rhizobium gallicum bv. gallicum R602sp]|uniref:Uncharacterized protein n=1 Tax=Rhizobium gallicum bv. gallicum R602sp TaxID=1041138 RepID=A0A0B4XCL3_9HYPH|nr:hypothetical protein RGR602_PC01735 [Rhizobium gallicum bv. gallicum R602sp]